MNNILGTIIKAVGAVVAAGIGSVKPPVKTMMSATAVTVDPFSEMEKGRVLEWWVLVADK